MLFETFNQTEMKGAINANHSLLLYCDWDKITQWWRLQKTPQGSLAIMRLMGIKYEPMFNF